MNRQALNVERGEAEPEANPVDSQMQFPDSIGYLTDNEQHTE